MVGRTEGPWLNTFQPKIFRLKSEKIKTIYRHNPLIHLEYTDMRKTLRKYATNGNMPKNVLLRILRRTFKTRFFHVL
jgi:hypothetical protein